MSTSPRMKWPYPAEGVDPWYEPFEALVRAQDGSALALNDAKNIILSGGGLITWDASTNTVSWASPIQLNSALSGFIETIPAGSLVVPNDGDYGFVRFIPSPQANVELVLRAASVLPASDVDRVYALFRRRQNKLYWRNGGVLASGDSAAIIDDGPGGGSGAGNLTVYADGSLVGTASSLNFDSPLAVGGSLAPGLVNIELQLAASSEHITTTPFTLDPASRTRAFYFECSSIAECFLPSAATLPNQFVFIKSLTDNDLVIYPNGTESIDGDPNTVLYGRNAAVILQAVTLDEGLTWNWYKAMSSSGLDTIVTHIPLAIDADSDLTGYTALGAFSLDPSEYSSIDFVTVGAVTGITLSGQIQLWNLTDGFQVALHNYNGLLNPTPITTSNVALPSGTKTYEVRHRVTGGTTPSDRIFTSWAGLALKTDIAGGGSTGGIPLVTGVTASAPLASTGGATPDISLTGIVDVANGGTGRSTLLSNSVILGNGSLPVQLVPPGAAGQVLATDGLTWSAQSFPAVTSIDVSGGATGLTTSGGPITTSGTITLGGTLGIGSGGTGQTTKTSAFDALSPLTTAGDIVAYNGTFNVRLPVGADGRALLADSSAPTGISWGTINLGSAATVSGTLAVTSGGTGASTAFTAGSIVFAGTGGAYSQNNSSLFWDNLNARLGIGTSAPSSTFSVGNNLRIDSNGRLVAYDGATPANGQLLIGDATAGFWKAATLQQAGGITITTGPGTITISSVSGTVSSVSLDMSTTGLTTSALTSQTITSSGTFTIGGTLVAANGGTGINTYTVGDILLASGATTLSKLADVATGNVLLSGGVGAAPSYGKVGLDTHVSGTLPVANGGTNATSWTAGSVVFAGSGGTSLAQDNANFFWDDLNNRLGIGTSAPGYALVVKSGSAGFEFDPGTQSIGSTFGSGGNLAIFAESVAGSTGPSIYMGGSARADAQKNAFVYKVSGTEYFRIDGDASGHTLGNVGIGTSLPLNRLHVEVNSAGGVARVSNTNASGYSSIDFYNNGTQRFSFGHALSPLGQLQNRAYFYSQNSDLVITANDTAATAAYTNVWFKNTETVFNEQGINLDFRVEGDNDANLLVVDASADQVGIGTATPSAKLSVGASSQFRVDSVGNITRINDVPTSFPASQGAAGTVLTNDGAGTLSWAVPTDYRLATFDTAASAVGNTVAFSTNNTVVNANAALLAKSRVVGVVKAVGPYGTGQVQVMGVISGAKFVPGLTLAAGDRVYLSASDGLLTNTITTQAVQAEIGLVADASAYATLQTASVLFQHNPVVSLVG